jgi:tRNA modification GTPase
VKDSQRLPDEDTIVAIATPPGEGAIALVRLSGPDAERIARHLFRPAHRPKRTKWQSHRLYHGHLIDPASERVVDEVLLALMRAPRSYTGQDVVELSCHGGTAGAGEILRLLIAAGARPAERGEMTLRAFLNGKLDLTQAEAVSDAVAASTPAALSLAVSQLGGSLSVAVKRIRAVLIEWYAHLEASIDFSEDDVAPPDPTSLGAALDGALHDVNGLLATAASGRLYRQGIRIALAGRPNAGKSSLLNALLQAERAIVTPIPGTTRDVIEEMIDLLGIPATLADTAGITDTEDVVERLGVERSRAAVRAADVIALVVDGSEPLGRADYEVGSLVRGRPAVVRSDSDENGGGREGRDLGVDNADGRSGVVVVISKVDLGDRVSSSAAAQLVPGAEVVRVSSLTGEGLSQLRQALRAAAPGGHAPSGWGEAVVSNERHRDALQRARVALIDARAAVEARLEADAVCTDVREALRCLGEITGESVTDDTLNAIFARFCIGK